MRRSLSGRFLRPCSVLTAALAAALAGGCPIQPDALDDGLFTREDLATDQPRLTERIRQEQIAGGEFSLLELRRHGRRIFSTPFSQLDGYGDGPMNPQDPVSPGGRPSLQDNGVFLRFNGLDAQSCLECHSIVSAATIPMTFGVGGVGGSVTNAVVRPTRIDMTDTDGVGFAGFNGRFINPPFLFGSGGVELLGKEMTADLQALKEEARQNPGVDVPLVAKGVSFGVIRFEDGQFDTSRVEGVDADLVVKPFGRKGQFATVRAFDLDAMMFHFGMQPVEVVGADADMDGDGVVNEIMAGEISALHIFNTTLERSVEIQSEAADAGFGVFERIGCADCHIPDLTTERRELPYSFPEVPERPFDNEFYRVDLTADAPGFDPAPAGGIVVPLFADLKRHDMGAELAESFGDPLDGFFTTARLWGVADTAPYLHDGRALTLRDAILLHGGEAQEARDAFAALSAEEQQSLIDFLRSLRTPFDPGADLD